MVFAATAYLLMIFSHGEIHNGEYWRWYFPAFVIGSAGNLAAFLSTKWASLLPSEKSAQLTLRSITLMTSIPPQMSGVVSALFQVSLQVGTVIGLSVQAGFLSRQPGSFGNYANVQGSFWFQFGWCVLNLVIFLAFFRPGRVAAGSQAAAHDGDGAGKDEAKEEDAV